MKNKQMQALLTGPDGLGTALRVARGGRSMQQLADALAEAVKADPRWSGTGTWGSSKVSKLEMGRQLPTALEVDLWAEVTKPGAQAREQWHRLRNEAEAQRSVLRRRTPTIRDTAGSSVNRLESVAALTREIQHAVIPALLQTEAYTRAALAPAEEVSVIEAVIAELRERQEALRDPGKRFHFLIAEGVLRTIRGNAEIMVGQLDHLIGAGSLPGVTIGIIPLGTPLRGPVVSAGFTLYDLDEAVVGDGIEDHRYTGPHAAALRELLDAAWKDAVQDRAARKLILEISDALESS